MDADILLIILFIASTLFVVLLVIMVSLTCKIRKQAQKILQEVADLFKRVGVNQEVYYSCYEKRDQLLDENGNMVKVLGDIVACEINYPILAMDSNVPSKCYRIAFVEGGFGRDQNGYAKFVIDLFLRPANVKIPNWNIIEWNDVEIKLEHPIMGSLTLKNIYKKCHKVGEKLTLRQRATLVSTRTYTLEYSVVEV